MAKRGEVFLAKAELADAKQPLLLPVIILSDDNYSASGYALGVPITTDKREHRLPIKEGDCDCELAPKSAAQPDCMLKLHSSQLVKRIGRVKDEFYWELTSKIRELIE